MVYTIENEFFTVSVKQSGAELINLTSRRSKTEYLWQADPGVWASSAPVLFPVIGAVKNGFVRFGGNEFAVPRHGFVRNNPDIERMEQTPTSLTLGLSYSEHTLAIFPFKFNFRISFSLQANVLTVDHRIENLGRDAMYFSLGGHPAFRCPINEREKYGDYYLEFEAVENDVTWLLGANGLVSNETRPILENTTILPLRHELFNNDALIFKHLKSRAVSLKSLKSHNAVTVRFRDFPYLGIWAKPNGDFVCIEPWLGIADSEDATQELTEKEGILCLESGGVLAASYSLEITE